MDRCILATSQYLYTHHWKWIDVKIGNYENSNGIISARFFKALEVLRTLQDKIEVEFN
jgi:hypothetical protein